MAKTEKALKVVGVRYMELGGIRVGVKQGQIIRKGDRAFAALKSQFGSGLKDRIADNEEDCNAHRFLLSVVLEVEAEEPAPKPAPEPTVEAEETKDE